MVEKTVERVARKLGNVLKEEQRKGINAFNEMNRRNRNLLHRLVPHWRWRLGLIEKDGQQPAFSKREVFYCKNPPAYNINLIS